MNTIRLAAFVLAAPLATAQELAPYDDYITVDTVPPIGVPHGLTADLDEWSVHLRVLRTEDNGLRDGRDSQSSAHTFASGYSVAPTELTSTRAELEILYGIETDWNLYAVIPYVEKDMDMDFSGGGEFESDSSGVGDIEIGAIWTAIDDPEDILRWHLGLKLPTGSHDETGPQAPGVDGVLPFVMQPGTGTYDVQPGFTYMRLLKDWSWGFFAQGRLHLDRNDDDWAAGDSGRADFWVQRPIKNDLVLSLRFQGDWWGDYHGNNAALDFTRSPLEDDTRQGGSLVQAFGGAAWEMLDGLESSSRLELEVGFPIDDWRDGPQLEREIALNFGWRFSR